MTLPLEMVDAIAKRAQIPHGVTVLRSDAKRVPPRKTIAVAPLRLSERTPASSPRSAAPVQNPVVACVVVSPRVFVHCWVAIVLTHCFNTVVLGYIGALYLYLLGTSVVVDFTIYSVMVDVRYFPAIANMYFVLAGIHGCQVAIFVFRSIRLRKLVFRTPGDSILSQSRRVARAMSARLGVGCASSRVLEKVDQLVQTTLRYSPRPLSRFVAAFWTLLRMCLESMDVRSENYGLVYLSRELVLTSLQTYQTYRLSCLVPRLWMSNVMVGLLVLNCWATPLLHYAFRSDVGRIRLAGAFVNMVLDMVSYIGLPTALFVPYAHAFDTGLKHFDRSYMYTDVWLIEMINEVQLLLVISLYDAISKFLIALSVVRGLYSMTKLLCAVDIVSPLRAPAVSLCRAANSKSAAIAPAVLSSTQAEQLSAQLPRPRLPWTTARIERVGHYFLLLWGLLVLIAHLHASSLPAHPQCRLSTRPWFGTKPSCSLLEVNCMEEKSAGDGSDVDKILRLFAADRVEYLVIRHCPFLQLPTRLQTLRQLFGLKIFNSTILEWNEEAAVTNTHHPVMRFLFLVDVRMRELPIGMQSPDFPQTLKDVELSRTNLTTVPENLDTIWPPGMYIAFEECHLQEFPLVVLRMQPLDLSFGANNFTALPNELLEGFPLRVLLLSGNPIRSFPSNVAQVPQIAWFDLIGTDLVALPHWMDETFLASTFILAGHTPLCDRMVAAGEVDDLEPRALLGIFGLDCTMGFIGNGSFNWYPIDDESVRNPSYTLQH